MVDLVVQADRPDGGAMPGSGPTAAYPRDASIAEVFEGIAARHPSAAALVSNRQAIRRYVMRPYSGPVALFECDDRITDSGSDPAGAWATALTGPVDHRIVPGNHESMLREPHVVAFARELAGRLDEADGR